MMIGKSWLIQTVSVVWLVLILLYIPIIDWMLNRVNISYNDIHFNLILYIEEEEDCYPNNISVLLL
jgi:hypothetical protein